MKITEGVINNQLLKDLKHIEEVDTDVHSLDKKSFATGYSNGYVKGFYLARDFYFSIIGIGAIIVAILVLIFKLF